MAAIPTIIVPGTWAIEGSWYKPDSQFVKEGDEHGVFFVPPFSWSTKLDGVIGKNYGWIQASAFLYSYTKYFTGPVNMIAHSHGGQVAIYTLSKHTDVLVQNLITVATPVRKEMKSHAERARAHILNKWIHVYSGGKDIWQFFGGLFDGRIGVYREMPYAENVYIGGRTHSDAEDGLLDPMLWTDRNLWGYLR